MKAFFNNAKGCDWDKAIFSGWTEKELHNLASHMALGIVRPASERVSDFISRTLNGRPITPVEHQWLMKLAAEVKAGGVIRPAKLEEQAWSSSYVVIHDKDKIIVNKGFDGKEVLVNDLVPHAIKKRPGQSQAYSVLVFMLRLDKGKLVTVAPQSAWDVAFNKSTLVEPSALITLHTMVDEILADDIVFKSLTTSEKNNITGARWGEWMWELLQRMPLTEYMMLHHTICVNFCKIADMRGTRFANEYKSALTTVKVTRKDDPTTSEELKKAITKMEEAIPGLVSVPILSGSLPAKIRAPDIDGTLATAIKYVQNGVQFRGGDKSAGAMLSGGWGFSSFVSESTKRISMIASIIIGTCIKTPVACVDLHLSHTSDIVYLNSTFRSMFRRDSEGEEYLVDWRFVLVANLASSFCKVVGKHRVSTTPREDALQFYYQKTATETPRIDALQKVYSSVDSWYTTVKHLPYVCAWIPIYTEFFWPDERGRHSKHFLVDKWNEITFDCRVYGFGWGHDFKGFVSTVPLTWAERLFEGEIGRMEYHALSASPSSESWYRRVCTNNTHRNLAFLKPTKKTSGIINLIIPPSPQVIWRADMAGQLDNEEIEGGDWNVDDEGTDVQDAWSVVDGELTARKKDVAEEFPEQDVNDDILAPGQPPLNTVRTTVLARPSGQYGSPGPYAVTTTLNAGSTTQTTTLHNPHANYSTFVDTRLGGIPSVSAPPVHPKVDEKIVENFQDVPDADFGM